MVEITSLPLPETYKISEFDLEMYIIRPFPELEIIQLPNFYMDHDDLINGFREAGIMYFFDLKICKKDIDELITMYGFKNILLLKSEDFFLFVNTTMLTILEIGNKIRRKSNLKMFW